MIIYMNYKVIKLLLYHFDTNYKTSIESSRPLVLRYLFYSHYCKSKVAYFYLIIWKQFAEWLIWDVCFGNSHLILIRKKQSYKCENCNWRKTEILEAKVGSDLENSTKFEISVHRWELNCNFRDFGILFRHIQIVFVFKCMKFNTNIMVLSSVTCIQH